MNGRREVAWTLKWKHPSEADLLEGGVSTDSPNGCFSPHSMVNVLKQLHVPGEGRYTNKLKPLKSRAS